MRRLLFAGALALLPALALAQSSAGGSGSSGGTVSVSNFPATQPVSGTVAATQSGAWSTGLTGSLPAFAATPTFNLGALNGAALDASVQQVKTALGSPLQAGGSVSVSNFPATQAVSAASLPLASGAATAANQSSEIAQLTAANQRAVFSADFAVTSVAANATLTGPTKDVGASPSAWSWISFNGSATVTGGIFYIQASTDNYSASYVTVAAVTVQTASTNPGSQFAAPVTISDRIRYRYYRVLYVNGSTAGTVTGATALTVN